MKPPCRKTLYLTFVLNVLALKIIVGAEVVSDGQDWTHKDTAGTGKALTKKWTPSVDFKDPNNWEEARVPSSGDVAAFREDTEIPIVFPSTGVDVCEMVLPASGRLILQPDSEIVISGPSSKNAGRCVGQTVKFKRKTPMEWVDPDNWSNKIINEAAPHVERIPCEHDTVFFNPENSFSVIVPDFPINIGAIKFGNQTFDQNDLNEFLLTDAGDQVLKSSSLDIDASITLSNTVCEDPTGCDCGTQQLLDQVCNVVSKRCNYKLGCISPVKPIGHCCWICGAYFLVNYDPRYFNFENLSEIFNKDLNKIESSYQNYKPLVHMSKLFNENIQVVLVSGTKYVDEIDEISKTINSILTSYIEGDMGIRNVNMFNSGLSYDVDGMTFSQKALTTCIIVFSCMVATVFYYTHNWKSILFSSGSSTSAIFVKFKNDTNDVELINEDVRIQRKSSFNNPTYVAVEKITQSQTFGEGMSYSDLTVSTIENDTMDVELKETREEK